MEDRQHEPPESKMARGIAPIKQEYIKMNISRVKAPQPASSAAEAQPAQDGKQASKVAPERKSRRAFKKVREDAGGLQLICPSDDLICYAQLFFQRIAFCDTKQQRFAVRKRERRGQRAFAIASSKEPVHLETIANLAMICLPTWAASLQTCQASALSVHPQSVPLVRPQPPAPSHVLSAGRPGLSRA